MPSLTSGSYILAVGHCCSSETDVRTNAASYVQAPYLDYRVTFSQDVAVAPPSEVPVPAALPLFASAVVGGGVIAWRKMRRIKKKAVIA